MTVDLLLRDAYVLERDAVVDVAVDDGRIVAIDDRLDEDADREIEVGEAFVSPGLVDCHLHIDKAFAAWGERRPTGNDGPFEFERIAEEEHNYYADATVEEIRDNAIRDVQLAVEAGSTYLRSHVTVDADVRGTGNMEASVAARERTDALADIQLVPAPRDEFSEVEREYLHEAVEMGTDDDSTPHPVLVGGSDPASKQANVEGTIEAWFELAREHDLDMDLHIQDGGNVGVYTLERLIDHMDANDYAGRVTASHSYGLAHIPDWQVEQFLDAAGEVDLKFVTCYQSCRPTMPVRRMLETDRVTLGHGTDNDRDFVFAHGNADSVEAMLILLNKLHGDRTFVEEYRWFESNEGLETLWDMITYQSARVLGIEDEYGIEVGNPANLVVFDQPSPQWTIVDGATRRYVIKDGTVVVENDELLPEFRVVEPPSW